jgi:hypothetical protein
MGPVPALRAARRVLFPRRAAENVKDHSYLPILFARSGGKVANLGRQSVNHARARQRAMTRRPPLAPSGMSRPGGRNARPRPYRPSASAARATPRAARSWAAGRPLGYRHAGGLRRATSLAAPCGCSARSVLRARAVRAVLAAPEGARDGGEHPASTTSRGHNAFHEITSRPRLGPMTASAGKPRGGNAS